MEPLTGNAKMPQDLLEGDSKRPITKDQAALPDFSEPQVRQKVAVIPSEYGNLQ